MQVTQVAQMEAAKQWIEFAADPSITPTMRRFALAAARECERRASGETALCLCCGKPFTRGSLH